MAEEKILVSVRVRPLNEKEKSRNDRCDWECINNTTIICKYNTSPDKSSYTFDKVFGFDCPTKKVYDDGAKEVALCVLDGINSSIFAYGQTSSGKTYTMSGITEFAMEDIFAYIEKHKKERKFTLKFSAMEIYNEAVKDLLCEDNNNTPLRLLDDPERGTVVEKLKEETLVDKNHLDELLSICETQRKIGETSLNETSSRSHQILRLTIESSSRDFSPESSATLAASVCFIDLAGSERASQTLSAGSRLKEGCHINRSLLTLGTVIRKLSKGKNGHIPYRDSKLTRILQNSLGGNARTAIICTMSPARSHLEQSRNTLHFASCAKEVTTNAKVNMVVTEKALVKQLQRELARMENELKNLGPASSSTSEFYALLKEKEELITKMEEQIQELKWQRDVAQSRVENLLKSTAEECSTNSSSTNNRRISYDSTDFGEPRMLNTLGKSNFYSPYEDSFLLDDTTPQFPEHDISDKWEDMAQNISQEAEDACKEVRCIEENSGEDSVDNIVEKKVMSLSAENEQNYISLMPDENEAMELSFDSKLDELTLKKLEEEEVQEAEEYVEKQKQSSKEEDMEQNLSKDQSCLDYNSLIVDVKAEDEAMESEKNDVVSYLREEDKEQNLSKDQSCLDYNSLIVDYKAENEAIESEKDGDDSTLETKDVDLSLSTKVEAQDEPTISKLEEEEVQETAQYVEKQKQSSKKEDMEQNLSMDQSCLDYKQNSESLMADEKAENEAKESEKEVLKIDMELSLDAELEVEDELTLNKLESQETEQSLEKEEAKRNSPSKKEVMEQNSSTDKEDDAYEALKNKVKEMQKTIEYFISMQSTEQKQSPSFYTIDDKTSPRSFLKMRRSRSCRESLLFTKTSGHFSNTSFGSDNTISIDAQSLKDSDTETSSSSFHEFMSRLKEMASKNHSQNEQDHNKDTETKNTKQDSGEKTSFERQQSQIVELWEVCNVPLVHRTYFYLLFKGGDPSDYVYIEVELRRLSFLKDSTKMMKKQIPKKALTREREWLAKQIPKKFGKKEKEEVYKKWDVEVSSKQRSLQVSNKLWNNTKEKEHWEESASLVATLVGFVNSNLTPKEMFGLNFSPTMFNNVKSSRWRLTNSFSRISLNGG